VEEKAKNTAHDQLLLHGTLASGAVISVHMRGGKPFKDLPGLEWRIYGETGEIRVLGPSAHVQMFGVDSISVHDFAADTVEEVDVGKAAGDLGNVSRVYEAIAEKVAKGEGYEGVLSDFGSAVQVHEFIAEMEKQNPGT
jgi:hypothetical protein